MMEPTERKDSLARALRASRFRPAEFATWLLGVALVLYLALESGGFSPITRGEIGLAVWWLIIIGTAATVLPLPWRTRGGLAMIAALGAFVLWTAFAFLWTESAERTATELARVVTYLGILVLALSSAGARGERARYLLGGVTSAIGLVLALAVLSRLHPAWFPPNTLGTFLPGIEIERRLAYPLGYSSAVGALAAIAVPLLLAAAASARATLVRGLAAAAIPLAGFALYLTTSGTGLAALIVALGIFLILAPDRLPKLGTLALAGVGTAILAIGLEARPALDRGVVTSTLERQGDELALIAIVVCAGVGLAHAGIGLAARKRDRPRWLSIDRRQAQIAIGVAVVLAIPVALAAGAPGELSDGWQDFKSRETDTSQTDRGAAILDASSSGRYQFWRAAVDAGETELLTGIGPGTFEFFWARSPDNFGFVRDAHSLYLENLGELGIVGFALILAFVLIVLGIGSVRSLRAPPAARLRIAAATAAAAGFAMAAALDWVWEIAALPALFMLLAATIATDREAHPEAETGSDPSNAPSPFASRGRRELAERAGIVAVSVIALVAVVPPLLGATSLRESQIEAASGNLDAALTEARNAVDAQPYAASPRLQEALILELLDDGNAAVDAAREATRRESTNWRTWITLSRLEARNGNPTAAVEAFRMARELRPTRLN